MKQLSQQTALIVVQFTHQLGDYQQIDIKVKDQPVLRIAKENRLVTTHGAGYVITIGLLDNRRHNSYQYQITLIVIDNPVDPTKTKDTIVFPIAFRDDVHGIVEKTCIITAGLVMETLRSQSHLTAYADEWLLNLQTDGYAQP